MFKVVFGDSSPFEVEIYRSGRIEPCIEVALALHRTSNTVHKIRVYEQFEAETPLDTKLTLVRSADELYEFAKDAPARCKSAKNE